MSLMETLKQSDLFAHEKGLLHVTLRATAPFSIYRLSMAVFNCVNAFSSVALGQAILMRWKLVPSIPNIVPPSSQRFALLKIMTDIVRIWMNIFTKYSKNIS